MLQTSCSLRRPPFYPTTGLSRTYCATGDINYTITPSTSRRHRTLFRRPAFPTTSPARAAAVGLPTENMQTGRRKSATSVCSQIGQWRPPAPWKSPSTPVRKRPSLPPIFLNHWRNTRGHASPWPDCLRPYRITSSSSEETWTGSTPKDVHV